MVATVVRKLKPTHPEWIVPIVLLYFPKLGTPYGQCSLLPDGLGTQPLNKLNEDFFDELLMPIEGIAEFEAAMEFATKKIDRQPKLSTAEKKDSRAKKRQLDAERKAAFKAQATVDRKVRLAGTRAEAKRLVECPLAALQDSNVSNVEQKTHRQK